MFSFLLSAKKHSNLNPTCNFKFNFKFNFKLKNLTSLLFLFFLSAGIISLSGCTTRLKKAQNMLVEKNYDEALKIFEEVLGRDPKNEEAQLGLRQAREGVIDKNLIKVRLLRLGGNVSESFEMIKSIMDQQNGWQLFPTGVVAFTQKEELGFAFGNLKRELRAALDQQRTLKASYMVQRYSFMFGEQQKNELKNYQTEAAVQGQKLCKDERKSQSVSVSFWSVFVEKVCSYYKVARGPKEKPLKIDRKLYKSFSSQFSSQKFDNERPERSLDSLAKAFAATAWYDAESTTVMTGVLKAEYSFRHDKTPRWLTHHYKLKVPYTQYEKRQEMNATTGKMEEKSVPVTVYREEDKSLSYQAIEHSLKAELNIDSEIQGTDFKMNFAFNAHENGEGIESFDENPQIQLYKQTPRNISPSANIYEKFLRNYFEEGKKKFIEKYQELYCTPIASQTDTYLKSDFALKCLRQSKSNPPPAAAQWSRDKYFLEVNQLDELIGLN